MVEYKIYFYCLNTMKKLDINIDIFLLIIVALVHSLFTLAVFTFIIITPFNIDIPIVSFMAFLMTASFILFQRCIATDWYDYIKNNVDVIEEKLPFIAKDNFLRKYIQNLFIDWYNLVHPNNVKSKKKTKKRKLKELRLDILKNFEPLIQKEGISANELKSRHNHRLHYILLNIIVIMMLIYKFKLIKLTPFLLIWIFIVFDV